MKTSIRDIVRREKWATAYGKAIAEEKPRDDNADTITIRVRLPWPEAEWMEMLRAEALKSAGRS